MEAGDSYHYNLDLFFSKLAEPAEPAITLAKWQNMMQTTGMLNASTIGRAL